MDLVSIQWWSLQSYFSWSLYVPAGASVCDLTIQTHSFFFFNWLMIGLQYFISAIHQHELAIGVRMSPSSWISLPSPTLSHPSRLLQSPSLSSLSHRVNFHWLSIFYIWKCVYLHATLSIHLTFSFLFPALVRKSVFYVCISTAALWTGSSVPSF